MCNNEMDVQSPADGPVEDVWAVRTLSHHHGAEVHPLQQEVAQQRPLEAERAPAAQFVAAGERERGFSSAWFHTQNAHCVEVQPRTLRVTRRPGNTLCPRAVHVTDQLT